ncbi:MAG: leucyl/phenylalanyl-tRNA--protein transferase [Thermodesulfobacteriota bacterium]
MPYFNQDMDFPDPAREDVDDLLAIGGDLSPQRLISAYSKGIFPWFSQDSPILWWSPDPRMVLFPSELHIPRRLQRTLAQGRLQVSLNLDFQAVITSCASVKRKGSAGTWIVPSMIQAYTKLHQLGYAHSLEVWDQESLAGGIYGVALRRAFFGESMFHRVTNASKVALVYLARRLQEQGFYFLDCQQSSRHLQGFGARDISRKSFLQLLKKAQQEPEPGTECWQPGWLNPGRA